MIWQSHSTLNLEGEAKMAKIFEPSIGHNSRKISAPNPEDGPHSYSGIVKTSPTDRSFTKIDNSVIDDPNISNDTLGFFVRLQKHPSGWKLIKQHMKTLQKKRFNRKGRQMQMSNDKLNQMLNELSEVGLYFSQQNLNKKGKFQSYDRVLFPYNFDEFKEVSSTQPEIPVASKNIEDLSTQPEFQSPLESDLISTKNVTLHTPNPKNTTLPEIPVASIKTDDAHRDRFTGHGKSETNKEIKINKDFTYLPINAREENLKNTGNDQIPDKPEQPRLDIAEPEDFNIIRQTESAFVWRCPKTDETHKLKFSLLQKMAPSQDIKRLKQFAEINLEIWVTEGKDGNLIGLMRHVVTHKFPKWLAEQTMMERNLQKADDVVTNYDPDDDDDFGFGALPPVIDEENLQ